MTIARHLCTAIIAIALLSLPVHAQAQEELAARQSDWRRDLGVLRIGLINDRPDRVFRRGARPLATLLRKSLGLPVEILQFRNHTALEDAIADTRIDYAALSTVSFARLRHACKCVDPVVVPADRDGATSFRSVLLAHASGPRSLSLMLDTPVHYPGSRSFAGYLWPKAVLAGDNFDFDRADWSLNESATAMEAAMRFTIDSSAALMGWLPSSDNRTGVSTKGGTAQVLARAGFEGGLRVIWKSPAVPHGPHIIRSKLPKQAQEKLRETMLSLYSNHPSIYDWLEPVHGGGFRKTDMKAFAPVLKALARPDLNGARVSGATR